MEWWHSGSSSSAPKDSECKNPLEKFSLASKLCDQDDFLLIHYLPQGQTIKEVLYSSLLMQVKDVLKENRSGKFTKGLLFLHDNTPAHRTLATQKKRAYLGFQCLDLLPYFPYLPPSDYHLFPGLKKNNWKVAIFLPTQRSLLTWRLSWTDNFWIFFEWLAKVSATV